MSGSDFRWWLEDIWFDLMNLGTADLPSLFFRLVLLFLVAFFGMVILRTVLTVVRALARDYLLPLVRLVWDVLTAPVRLPYRLLRRIQTRREERRKYELWVQEQQEWKDEQERERREEEARERERLAALERMLRPD